MRFRFLPLIALAALSLAACDTKDPYFAPEGDLIIEDVEVGTGEVVDELTDVILIAYTGTLLDETVFDSSDSLSRPLGSLIPGFQEGMMGMREGGNRKLTIPSRLAYGSVGTAGVPGNATLFFDITLKAVNP